MKDLRIVAALPLCALAACFGHSAQSPSASSNPQLAAMLAQQKAAQDELESKEEEQNKAALEQEKRQQEADVAANRGKRVEKDRYRYGNALTVEPEGNAKGGALMKVTDEGQGARRLLKVEPKPGTRRTGTFTVFNNPVNGVQLGNFEYTVDTTVSAPQGDDTPDAVYVDAKCLDIKPDMMKTMWSDSLTHTVRIKLLPDGSLAGMVPDNLPEYAAHMKIVRATACEGNIGGQTVSLPDVPVGPGAKWTSKIQLDVGTVKIRGPMKYELVSAEGNKVHLKSSFDLKADGSQPIQYKPNGCHKGEGDDWKGGPAPSCTQRLQILRNDCHQDRDIHLDLTQALADKWEASLSCVVDIIDVDTKGHPYGEPKENAPPMRTAFQAQ